MLHPEVNGLAPLRGFAGPSTRTLASLLPNQDLLTDPSVQSALLGLIEARRNIALVLRHLHSLAESEAMLASATRLARANGLDRPIVAARLLRTRGITAEDSGHEAEGLTDLAASAAAFGAALPGSKPLADTDLLDAAGLLRRGQADAALPDCREAVRTLVALRVGTDPDLIEPCLDVYAAVADKAPPAARQGLLDEMFTASQLAQGSITSQQIAEATARLQENARDPKVAEAIRARQDAGARLRQLYRQRDQEAGAARTSGTPITPAATAALDKQIDAARVALADADSAVQAAAPNYGQLVQQVVSAKTVFAELHPHEAFAQITLGAQHGWVFLLHDRRIAISRVPGGLDTMAKLVRQIRAGIELTSTSLPVFNVTAAQTLYTDTLGGVAKQLKGVKDLVISPAGPLLSLPFEVLLTGPANPDTAGRRTLAGTPVHHLARAGGGQLRLAPQDRRQFARHPALVRLRRLPAADPGTSGRAASPAPPAAIPRNCWPGCRPCPMRARNSPPRASCWEPARPTNCWAPPSPCPPCCTPICGTSASCISPPTPCCRRNCAARASRRSSPPTRPGPPT